MQNPVFRQTWAEIDLACLDHNFRQLRKLVKPESFFCPMLKANAYGHGSEEIFNFLASRGLEATGVALVEEGLALREQASCEEAEKVEVLVFGSFNREGARALVHSRLTPVLSEWGQLRDMLEVVPDKAYYPVHLKFDTGMHRMGFQPEEAEQILKQLRSNKQLRIVGVCTHLSDGLDFHQAQGRSSQQMKKFASVLSWFVTPGVRVHVLNSSALLAHVMSQGLQPTSWGTRPGLALYGIYPELIGSGPQGGPNEEESRAMSQIDLKPVMSLKSQLVQIHRLKAGERVSYGGLWTAEKSSVVGVVAMGYGDGYPRGLTQRGSMLVRGQEVSIVGSICMDYCMVDLTEVVRATGPVAVGDEVVVLGDQQAGRISAERLALLNNSIPYEILTNVSPRVPRIFKFRES